MQSQIVSDEVSSDFTDYVFEAEKELTARTKVPPWLAESEQDGWVVRRGAEDGSKLIALPSSRPRSSNDPAPDTDSPPETQERADAWSDNDQQAESRESTPRREILLAKHNLLILEEGHDPGPAPKARLWRGCIASTLGDAALKPQPYTLVRADLKEKEPQPRVQSVGPDKRHYTPAFVGTQSQRAISPVDTQKQVSRKNSGDLAADYLPPPPDEMPVGPSLRRIADGGDTTDAGAASIGQCFKHCSTSSEATRHGTWSGIFLRAHKRKEKGESEVGS